MCFFWVDQTQFSSKASEFRANVQGQSCHHVILSFSCEHHHVNNTMSKSSSRAGAIEKSNGSGTREFAGENSRVRNPVFFCFWPQGSRVSVSMGAGFDLRKLSTKSAQDCSKSSMCASTC